MPGLGCRLPSSSDLGLATTLQTLRTHFLQSRLFNTFVQYTRRLFVHLEVFSRALVDPLPTKLLHPTSRRVADTAANMSTYRVGQLTQHGRVGNTSLILQPELSVSNRAACQATACKNGAKIGKGELRQGVLVTMNENTSWKWRHW